MAKRKRKKALKIKDPQILEQKKHIKEIRGLMLNIGFHRLPGIDGKEFIYDGRKSELDDIFFFKNVVVLCEYTAKQDVGEHLKNKKIIYDKINANPRDFFKFLLSETKFAPLKQFYESRLSNTYTINQLQIKIIYASRYSIEHEHKALVSNVKYLDYSVAKYFESISRIIRKTSIYEFIDFLDIPYSKFGENIKGSATSSSNEFSGHILPEEQSSFKEGYKLVSFYIDAESLLKRAFVLRRDGWRSKDSLGLYQRMFVASKIKSMRRYLHSEKRVFINNLIVTLSTDFVTLLDENGEQMKIDSGGNFKNSNDTKVQPATINIENKSNIIGIIDGQHRLYAYHEGNDQYETSIADLRTVQNLLVTGILFPKNEPEEKRIKFEANLFLEINANQSSASAQLKQEIELMRNPFSTTSISKYVLNKLNESGPLSDMFEEFWFQKSKLKTSSIISFGLRQLVKFEGNDSLFQKWGNKDKAQLKDGNENYNLLAEYRDYCTKEMRKIFIGLKSNLDKDQWKVDRKDPKAILTVTTINGMINCLRLLVENNKLGDESYYKSKLAAIGSFPFKKYKSSQYRKMGEDIYKKYFH